MSEFKREPRYVIFKVKDLYLLNDSSLRERYANLLNAIGIHLTELRREHGETPLSGLVIERDWPEFEPVWESIEARLSDGLIQCLTCGGMSDGLAVRTRNIYPGRCFDCAEDGRSNLWRKVES